MRKENFDTFLSARNNKQEDVPEEVVGKKE